MTGVAIAAWSAAVALLVAVAYGWEAGHPLQLLALAVAMTATIAVLVGGSLAPIETSFKIGYSAGYTDGHREARPVVVPAIRLEQHREARGLTEGSG